MHRAIAPNRTLIQEKSWQWSGSLGYICAPSRLLARLMQHLRTAAMPLWECENGSGNRPLVREAAFMGLAGLTTREREILTLISQGIRDRDVANELHISKQTV